MTFAVADVLVYAADPDPTAAELVFDFVAGQTRFVIAGEPSDVNVDAVEATATGAAHTPSVKVSPSAGIGTGTGAAYTATVTDVSQVFVVGTGGVISYATEPAVGGSELGFDYLSGSVQLLLAHDQLTRTKVNAGPAASTGTANDSSVAVSTDATAAEAMGTGVAETPATGRTATEAVSVGAAADAQATVSVSAGATATVLADDPSPSVQATAAAAEAVSDMGFTSVNTAVPDPNARTITIRDHGHTISLKLRK